MSYLADFPLWLFEWSGALLGLSGASLLSVNLSVSRFGWLLFLLSNFAWIIYGIRTDAHGLVFMQLGFMVTSMQGVYRWLISAR